MFFELRELVVNCHWRYFFAIDESISFDQPTNWTYLNVGNETFPIHSYHR